MAATIELAGDQSAARRDIACALARLDPRAALEQAGRIRRPSDAARALGAIAAAFAEGEPAQARQAAITASRLLLRIVEPQRRDQEQRLLLADMAALGQDALLAGPEIPVGEARAAVVLARARSDPRAALGLLRGWNLSGPLADRALASIASGLSEGDTEQALELTNSIVSDSLRQQALWQIAESRPAAEAYGIAQRVSEPEPLVRSAILASVATRSAGESPELAVSAVAEVGVAHDSAVAEFAIALVATDEDRALDLARGLSEPARAWVLRRMSVELAALKPERAAAVLSEAGPTAEAARLVVGRMAAADPARAIQLARSLPEGEARDEALAVAASAVAGSDKAQARELVWQIRGPEARARGAESVVAALAESDADAATSLIGIIADQDRALRLRAKVAAAAARRDPPLALRLLESLPASDYRAEAALNAASALLVSGGSLEEALRFASLGAERDLALRWIIPLLTVSETGSPTHAAESITSPYLRALCLVEVGKAIQKVQALAQPSPSRGRMIRPVVEWEGM